MSPPFLQWLTPVSAGLLALLAGLAVATIPWLRAARARARGDSELIARLRGQLEATQADRVRLETQLAERDGRVERLGAEVNELRGALDSELVRASALRAELTAEREKSREKLALLDEARQRLASDFQNLANRIFEEKGKSLQEQQRQGLATLLDPLREQIKDFRGKVEQAQLSDSNDRAALREQLQQLRELNQQINTEAANLTRALKGESKTQGNWGEVILEKVLQEAGLRRGHEYETQVSIAGRQPDVIVRLPDGKDIIIDAKVSLVAYERAVNNNDDDAARNQQLADHVQSIRNHVRDLSGRDYSELPGLRSLDFVLMFIPVEAAFLAAAQRDPEIFGHAFARGVILVTPTTLFGMLRIVQNLWRTETQNRNAQRIADEAGKLHDQFVLFVEALQEVGSALEKAEGAYNKAHKRLTSGRGNLVKRTLDLKTLGARTRKSLPQAVQEQSRIDDRPDPGLLVEASDPGGQEPENPVNG